jgi:hypothetical protein
MGPVRNKALCASEEGVQNVNHFNNYGRHSQRKIPLRKKHKELITGRCKITCYFEVKY